MNENVITQNLLDFTVKIQRVDSESIVGTGIVVSIDGKVVTCAHVVKSAGVDPRTLDGKEVGVYFPQAQSGEKKDRRAKVIACFRDFDDDVVLLQLTDGNAPLDPDKMPVLGTAEASQGNPFRSYGCRSLGDYILGLAVGKIQGHVASPPKRNLQVKPVQLESSQINRGMSGSAVLDIDRNLVIGIISETWFPDPSTKDRDTAWAVDGRVLSLKPLVLPVRDTPLPLKAAPEPKIDERTKQKVAEIDVAKRKRTNKYAWNDAPAVFAWKHAPVAFAWNDAPAILKEWTGRDHLLAQITADWNDPTKHVTGLIGFGGEGKSSLARKWIDHLLYDPSQPQPYGLFWWGFYENRSIDEFLEALLNYVSGGLYDLRRTPSSNNSRAQIIGDWLGKGDYLLVLDGLEVVQHQEGDQYGLLQNNDLRELLTFVASPKNTSFCLITSRAPLLDLINYTTYSHRDVDRLSDADGRALLQKLGVKGSDSECDKVVADWDGHALTLSLLAAYLTERYEGDIKYVDDIPASTGDEPRYERVRRVLRRYDEHLTKDEREFLKLFSVFRLPVHEAAFEKVIERLLKKKGLAARLFGSKTDFQVLNIVKRLVEYRLIRLDEREKTYTAHPLIRSYYLDLFRKGQPAQRKAAHQKIREYYLSISGELSEYPTLDDLKPLIEVVHHACQAGTYDEADEIRRKRIYQGPRNVITYQLGASETDLNLMLEFFPDHSDRKEVAEPLVSDSKAKRAILNEIGVSLTGLGRLREAEPFYKKVAELDKKLQDDLSAASATFQNIAYWHELLGELSASAEAAGRALDFARRARDRNNEWISLANQAWIAHLLGDTDLAVELYERTEQMFREEQPQRYLYGLNGIRHADHLLRTNRLDYARYVAGANLKFCAAKRWQDDTSRSHRILGDINSSAGSNHLAGVYYEDALSIARRIQQRDVLIQALLARGRLLAKMTNVSQAFIDLNEALIYCVESGYRIYEADLYVALGWTHLAAQERSKAKGFAERAQQMSSEMGYYWGVVDARELLEIITPTKGTSKPSNKRPK